MVIAGFYDWPGLSIRRNTGGICRNGLETGISRPGAAGIVYKLACGVCCKMHPAFENCIQHLQFIQDAFWNLSNQKNFICTKINNINDLHEIHPNFTKQRKYLLVYMTASDICLHRVQGLRKT